MFMASWNNYMWPLIALQSDTKFTLPPGGKQTLPPVSSSCCIQWFVRYCAFHIANNHVFFTLQKSFVDSFPG